ncbi:hypothetical protein A0256_04165 [Mucilaginibacter sp. PAMC 26640]|nr:hypothetical protein A0256_04165 [Mucilaginibacter sp. PAMC 26640]
MVLTFEFLKVFNVHSCGQYILARLSNGIAGFEMKEGASFGGIAIDTYIEMPRIIGGHDEPHLDLFVFRPLNLLNKDEFIEGQPAELIIPD